MTLSLPSDNKDVLSAPWNETGARAEPCFYLDGGGDDDDDDALNRPVLSYATHLKNLTFQLAEKHQMLWSNSAKAHGLQLIWSLCFI